MWQSQPRRSSGMNIAVQALPTQVKLDPDEQHYRVPGLHQGSSLFLRRLAPKLARGKNAVLNVHGATFPSALSIAYRFDGRRSWRDALCAAGFEVWALDFHGFGGSDPYPEMRRPAELSQPLGRVANACAQLEAAVRFIGGRANVQRLSIIAHSWGTRVAGRLAVLQPDLLHRLVFFGPITWRREALHPARLPGWRLITLADQWQRFTEAVPTDAAPVLSRRHFAAWGECYLASDADSRRRSPAAVKVPSGPFQDIFDAWAGQFAYDPAHLNVPVAIIRGEWDNYCSDTDAHWLFNALSASPMRRDIKIGRGTHLMHLEAMRGALYRESIAFLSAGDEPALGVQ
jgi:pimeloyl-ACP methyl ester carboxylesterase